MSSYPIAMLPTYVAAAAPFVPPSTPTDVLSLAGSATRILHVSELEFYTTQTIGGVNTWYVVKRSAPNTGGTSSGVPAVPVDSADAAATASCLTWTAKPTALGAAEGTVWAGRLSAPAPISVVGGDLAARVDFLELTGKPLVLRGASEMLSLNFGGAALPIGLSVNGTFTWVEE
jgi:hypothetical protein